MDAVIEKELLSRGWNPNTPYPNTDRWHFFEIRNFNLLRVVCVVEEGIAAKEEVQAIKDYLRQRMPWITLRDMGLVIVFSESPQFVDLSKVLSKYAEKITVQKIVQLTPEKVFEQNTWVTGIVDRYLGDFLLRIAGPREVLTNKIDGGVLESIWNKNWMVYIAILVIVLEVLRHFL